VRFIILFFSSGAGSGYSPIMPGTAGSIIGVLCYLLFQPLSPLLYLISLTAVFFLSIWISGRAEKIYGVNDDRRIVIDEIVGILISMAGFKFSPMIVTAGFLIFRFFDIAKVFPANIVQSKLNGGLAIVLDDVVAGIYTNITLHVLKNFL